MRALIVGCGLYGVTSARKLAEFGNEVHIIEKRNHVAGNCFTENNCGIHVHKYGPHAFHTNSKKIWDFVNQFAEFNNFKLKVLVNNKNKIYSFPINLLTMNQVYGFDYNKSVDFLNKNTQKNYGNFKDFVISSVGEELYKIFYEGYTKKQWNKDPSDLPSSIAKRIPVRLNFYDYYFEDIYQGVPVSGYTSMVENMLDHPNIKVDLNVDFFPDKKEFEQDFDLIIYTGKPDEYFDYRFGLLEYRSLRFEEKFVENTFQGNVQINYASMDVPYTRIVEHKYFHNEKIKHSVITYEYPDNYEIGKIPYYPIESEANKQIYNQYFGLIENQEKVLFGGRLGKYTYLNMDQVIGMALNDMEKICQKSKIHK
jgi:UDP-galactopyranose mutase